MYHVSVQGIDERMINGHYYYYYESGGVKEGPQKGLTWPLPFGIVPPAVMSQGDRKAPIGHDTTSSAWSRPPSCDESGWWKGPNRAWHNLFRLGRPPSCDESGWQKGPNRAWHDLFRLESSHQLWWVKVTERPQQGMTRLLPLGIVPPAVPLWWTGGEGKASEVCTRPLFLCFGCFLLGLAACCRGLPASFWS